MSAKAGWSTPMLHVADVARSLRFYALLGFETVDVEGPSDCPGWARMHCEGGALMFFAAEEPAEPPRPGIMLYLYTPELPALRAQLAAAGIDVSPVSHPEYMRSGEMQLRDPDGNVVFVGQWGDEEHTAWERRVAEKRARGLL